VVWPIGTLIRRPVVKRVILALSITLAIALAFGLIYFQRASSQPSVVGVWKGTDQYGHEHYFEFHKDGTLTWWDRDRSHDGSFQDRGPFSGSYKYEDRMTVAAKSNGWPPQPLGTLALVSENELKQDDSGHAARKNLVYRRVAGE
jgi:hypothetical protein